MRVGDATAIARRWVAEEASTRPGFIGAFVAGSTHALPGEALLPPTSDIDIKVIVETLDAPRVPHKLLYRGVVLDVSAADVEEAGSAEAILGSYYLAGHFVRPTILADPLGVLARLQTVVAHEYPRRRWVRARCEHARNLLEESLTWWNPYAPLHDQVFSWLYATLLPSHLLLVADLRNPTIRKGLVASREVLGRYGRAELHERLLERFGSAAMGRQAVERHLAACAEAFDRAKHYVATPFFGASLITDFGRPIAIDGGRELIEGGWHREAMFWIAIIHTWAQTALQNDAPEDVRDSMTPAYEHVLASIGIADRDDLGDRIAGLEAIIPELWAAAEHIVATNSAIVD